MDFLNTELGGGLIIGELICIIVLIIGIVYVIFNIPSREEAVKKNNEKPKTSIRKNVISFIKLAIVGLIAFYVLYECNRTWNERDKPTSTYKEKSEKNSNVDYKSMFPISDTYGITEGEHMYGFAVITNNTNKDVKLSLELMIEEKSSGRIVQKHSQVVRFSAGEKYTASSFFYDYTAEQVKVKVRINRIY